MQRPAFLGGKVAPQRIKRLNENYYRGEKPKYLVNHQECHYSRPGLPSTKHRDRNMSEPVALPWRTRLGDDYAVNLPIVLDDGHKLPNRLASAHPALQGIENIFEPVIHIVDLERTAA